MILKTEAVCPELDFVIHSFCKNFTLVILRPFFGALRNHHGDAITTATLRELVFKK